MRYVELVSLGLALLLAPVAAVPAVAQDMKTVSSSLASRIAASGHKAVAVVDFTDLQGNVTELGRFLAEELSVDLVGDAKGFEVIERTQLKVILQEHKLATTGLIDPQTARKLGQIAGADALVTGVITPFGDSVRLSAKVLDTTTARMIGASTADVPKTRAIEELLARGIGDIYQASALGPSATAPGTRPGQPASQKEDDFSFDVPSCQRSGMTVSCRLLITNRGDDRQLGITGQSVSKFFPGTFISSSRAFDQVGNEYKAATIRLGNKENDGYVESLLVSGVPTNATLIFERVSADATRLALLEIGCYRLKDHQPKTFTVQIRNILLGK